MGQQCRVLDALGGGSALNNRAAGPQGRLKVSEPDTQRQTPPRCAGPNPRFSRGK